MNFLIFTIHVKRVVGISRLQYNNVLRVVLILQVSSKEENNRVHDSTIWHTGGASSMLNVNYRL